MPTECDELSTTGYQRIRSEDQDLKARSHFKRSCERPRIHHYETPLTAVQASQEFLISSTGTALLARVRTGEDSTSKLANLPSADVTGKNLAACTKVPGRTSVCSPSLSGLSSYPFVVEVGVLEQEDESGRRS